MSKVKQENTQRWQELNYIDVKFQYLQSLFFCLFSEFNNEVEKGFNDLMEGRIVRKTKAR